MEHDSQDDAGQFRFSPRPNRAGEIRWSPWGEEAFLRADRERKPVLLSISAVWCHWCHVMDETTYSDTEVIDLINRFYVPVRVDTDREPDINRRYNQGGWPTTAFLSPRGALLAGTTYIPPDRMRLVLRRIYELYTSKREELERMPLAISLPTRSRGELSPALVEEAAASLLAAWDRRFGGLGREPKFPHPEALDLALHAYRRGMGDEYRTLAESSLAAMIEGNLRDRVEGGFFRYSTTRDWSVPHYEKMLADNAGLLSTLLRAYGATGKRVYLDTAAETARFVLRTLSDGIRLFFGSQDADEEYYLLDSGARKTRAAPSVDDTVYVDTSARAAASFLQAWAALGEVAFRDLALNFLDFAWSELYLPRGGMAHYHRHGSAGRRGLLDDQVEAALAFQQAFSLTGDRVHLERAETLLSLVRDAFWDAESGLLMDTMTGFSPPGLRPAAADIPAVARAAEAFLRQHYLRGGGEWKVLAADLLSSVAKEAEAYGHIASPFALALDLFLEGPLMVRIGGGDVGATRRFLSLAAISPDHRVIPLLEEGGPREEEEPRAEVCGEKACVLRTGRPEEVAGYLGIDEGII